MFAITARPRTPTFPLNMSPAITDPPRTMRHAEGCSAGWGFGRTEVVCGGAGHSNLSPCFFSNTSVAASNGRIPFSPSAIADRSYTCCSIDTASEVAADRGWFGYAVQTYGFVESVKGAAVNDPREVRMMPIKDLIVEQGAADIVNSSCMQPYMRLAGAVLNHENPKDALREISRLSLGETLYLADCVSPQMGIVRLRRHEASKPTV